MRIGFVVDGQAESQALRYILRRIPVARPIQLLDPIYADMQPMATAAQIAKSAERAINLVFSRGAHSVVVLLDREEQPTCPGLLANDVGRAITGLGFAQVCVVVKDRRFENWLISDPDNLATKMSARFQVSPSFRRRVSPNRADSVSDAEALLNSIIQGKEFHKLKDACRIGQIVDIERAAANSRSFRRLLRVVGVEEFATQSRLPV